jgi:hypothetical protein
MSRLDDVTIGRSAWGAKPATGSDQTFTKDGGMVAHHTAVHSSRIVSHWPDCYEAIRGHQRYHQRLKNGVPVFWDLAYNWLICKHGFAFEGRGWNFQNGANTPVNSSTLSICWEGHGGQELPIEPVVETYRNLIVEAVGRGWDMQVRAHSEVSTTGTICPGSNFRSAVLPQLKGYVELDNQKLRQQTYQRHIECAKKRQSGQYRIDMPRCLFTGPVPGNERP